MASIVPFVRKLISDAKYPVSDLMKLLERETRDTINGLEYAVSIGEIELVKIVLQNLNVGTHQIISCGQIAYQSGDQEMLKVIYGSVPDITSFVKSIVKEYVLFLRVLRHLNSEEKYMSILFDSGNLEAINHLAIKKDLRYFCFMVGNRRITFFRYVMYKDYWKLSQWYLEKYKKITEDDTIMLLFSSSFCWYVKKFRITLETFPSIDDLVDIMMKNPKAPEILASLHKIYDVTEVIIAINTRLENEEEARPYVLRCFIEENIKSIDRKRLQEVLEENKLFDFLEENGKPGAGEPIQKHKRIVEAAERRT